MRVALDGAPLTVSSGGTRRYTVELARALAAAFPQDIYRLMSDQPFGDNAPRIQGLDRYWWLCGLSRQREDNG